RCRGCWRSCGERAPSGSMTRVAGPSWARTAPFTRCRRTLQGGAPRDRTRPPPAQPGGLEMALLRRQDQRLLRARLLRRRARLALDIAAVGAHLPGIAAIV